MWPHAKASSPDLGLYAKGPNMRHVTYLSVLTYFPNNTARSGSGKDRISGAASQTPTELHAASPRAVRTPAVTDEAEFTENTAFTLLGSLVGVSLIESQAVPVYLRLRFSPERRSSSSNLG